MIWRSRPPWVLMGRQQWCCTSHIMALIEPQRLTDRHIDELRLMLRRIRRRQHICCWFLSHKSDNRNRNIGDMKTEQNMMKKTWNQKIPQTKYRERSTVKLCCSSSSWHFFFPIILCKSRLSNMKQSVLYNRSVALTCQECVFGWNVCFPPVWEERKC